MSTSLTAAADEILLRCPDLFRDLNLRHFGGRIRPPAFRPSRARCQAGCVDYRTWTIAVSIPYHRAFGAAELADTLKHEMIHLHLFQEHGRNQGHGPRFREWAGRIGAPRHARPLPRRPPRWVYRLRCPACGLIYRRFRLWRDIACGACCRTANDGRYAARFRLIHVDRRPYQARTG